MTKILQALQAEADKIQTMKNNINEYYELIARILKEVNKYIDIDYAPNQNLELKTFNERIDKSQLKEIYAKEENFLNQVQSILKNIYTMINTNLAGDRKFAEFMEAYHPYFQSYRSNGSCLFEIYCLHHSKDNEDIWDFNTIVKEFGKYNACIKSNRKYEHVIPLIYVNGEGLQDRNGYFWEHKSEKYVQNKNREPDYIITAPVGSFHSGDIDYKALGVSDPYADE